MFACLSGHVLAVLSSFPSRPTLAPPLLVSPQDFDHSSPRVAPRYFYSPRVCPRVQQQHRRISLPPLKNPLTRDNLDWLVKVRLPR